MNPPGHNHTDEAVARVLDTLRSAEPPPGMEARILKAIEQSAGKPSASTPRIPLLPRVWFWRPQFVYSLATVAVFALALGLRAYRPQSAVRPAPAHTSRSRSPLGPPSFTQAQLTPSPRLPRVPERHRARRTFAVPYSVRLDSTQPERESFPAPEAPLTVQEQLLLRIIHQGDPEEIAALNPGLRAVESAQEAAEFDEFFKPKISIPAASLPPATLPNTNTPTTNPGTNERDPNEPARP